MKEFFFSQPFFLKNENCNLTRNSVDEKWWKLITRWREKLYLKRKIFPTNRKCAVCKRALKFFLFFFFSLRPKSSSSLPGDVSCIQKFEHKNYLYFHSFFLRFQERELFFFVSLFNLKLWAVVEVFNEMRENFPHFLLLSEKVFN